MHIRPRCDFVPIYHYLQLNETPLHKAARTGSTEACRLLIDAGAAMDAVSGVRRTLKLLLPLLAGRKPRTGIILCIACANVMP